jgi:hypothetical protein
MHTLIIMTKIFESPDHGETVYVRAAGSTERALHSESEQKRELRERIRETKLWADIRRRARTHPGLQDELNRVIMFYQLMNERHGR